MDFMALQSCGRAAQKAGELLKTKCTHACPKCKRCTWASPPSIAVCPSKQTKKGQGGRGTKRLTNPKAGGTAARTSPTSKLAARSDKPAFRCAWPDLQTSMSSCATAAGWRAKRYLPSADWRSFPRLFPARS